MNNAVLLPENPTNADLCAAAEGVMQDTVHCKVNSRVEQPADLATAYERLAFGSAGRNEYTFYKKSDDGQVLLSVSELGFFFVSLD